MKFAEFQAVQTIRARPYAVSEAVIRQLATAYDPQWVHTDAAAAAQGRFGGVAASTC